MRVPPRIGVKVRVQATGPIAVVACAFQVPMSGESGPSFPRPRFQCDAVFATGGFSFRRDLWLRLIWPNNEDHVRNLTAPNASGALVEVQALLKSNSSSACSAVAPPIAASPIQKRFRSDYRSPRPSVLSRARTPRQN